ncbi:hypothetical protein D3C74_424750 [compost metagenome]
MGGQQTAAADFKLGTDTLHKGRHRHKSFQRTVISFAPQSWPPGLNDHLADRPFGIHRTPDKLTAGHHSRADIDPCMYIQGMLNVIVP